VVMRWSSQFVTWNPHNSCSTPHWFYGKYGGLLASSVYPRASMSLPPYLSPYFPYFH